MVTYINKNTHAIYAGNTGEAPMDVQNGSVFHEMDTGLYYMYDAEHNQWLVQEDNGGGSGGTTDHTQLTNRDKPDQHPIEAITGLKEKVDNPLGLSNVSPGDLIKVKAVDASGEPTEWEKTSLEELEGKWELIEEITLNEAAIIDRDKEPDGTLYNFKEMYVIISLPERTKGWHQISIGDGAGRSFYYGGNAQGELKAQYFGMEATRSKGYLTYKGFKMTTNYDVFIVDNAGENYYPRFPDIERTTYIKAVTSNLPAGANVKIWAVRA